jgi:hypothetical protein
MTLKRSLAAVAVLMGVTALPVTSHAAVLAGNLNGTGSLGLTNGVVTFTNAGPVGGGVFVIDPSSTGSFTPLAGTTATIQPLSVAGEPPGMAVNVPNFITFAPLPTVSVTLTLVRSGLYNAASCAAAPAAGQSCTPMGTWFNFTNLTATSSILSFAIEGTVVDLTSPGQTSALTGLFTAQFATASYQSVLAAIAGGGAIPTTYSASFAATPNGAPTPTPTTTPTTTTTATATTTQTATSTPSPGPNGSACTDPGQCESTFCVDDVCCDSACTGPAEQCNLPGQTGICASVTAAAPALTPRALTMAIALLAGIAALALRRRPRRGRLS